MTSKRSQLRKPRDVSQSGADLKDIVHVNMRMGRMARPTRSSHLEHAHPTSLAQVAPPSFGRYSHTEPAYLFVKDSIDENYYYICDFVAFRDWEMQNQY